ncbi:MAG: RNA methyltransferase [Clostridia bacterium]|nr:RNA methyltransferase [Clostridia bacterium]
MNIIEIKSISDQELLPYAHLTEAQLKRAGEGEGLFIAESPNVAAAAIKAGYEPVSFLTERKLLSQTERSMAELCGDTPVFVCETEVFEGITGFHLSRGVLAAMKRKPLPEVGELVSGMERIAVMEGVSDASNIGSIFRSAAALGMDAVLASANCCDPLNRRAARVSMGTVFQIPWTVLPCMETAKNRADIALLQALGFKVAAMALDDNSVSVSNPALKNEKKLAVLLGAEGNGLDKETIKACDYTVKIPMFHGVDSLNVAAASAVAFWEISGKSSE